MPDSDSARLETLTDWAQRECRHLDLIASWEELMGAYAVLGFTGPEDDEIRLGEFKIVIGELNKFLTRMKNGLARTKDYDAAIDFLGGHMNTSDMNAVKTRPNIAYNKLKQRWIRQSIFDLTAMNSTVVTEEGERDE